MSKKSDATSDASAGAAASVPTGNPSAPTMQEVILRLQKYWAGRGLLIQQPFNTEVGAGTANPATLLRVLGPEPWSVAYVEPSVRPDDSRYGENPNRLQTHTQYQVILKPDPGNPQELYLESLEALGIDTHAHDLRFVEDNWASPALGAWGLGWEVWLDGMEITQFTYFQQAGGISLDPVSVEITYGLERIVMALQGVSHFKDIRFAEGVTYGEIYGQSEYEMSRYYLDDADVDLQRRLFDAYAEEAERMLDLSLPVPAYSYILKCSHTFNVLDARGAISTTERARTFGLMRGLMRRVARLWLERREELEYPLGVVTAQLPPAPAPAATPADPTATSPLVIEIGFEELPHTDVRATADAVRRQLVQALDASSLPHGEVAVKSTPRRVVALVDAVAAAEPDSVRTVRGPRSSAAFDANDEPTKALAGFLRGHDADVADVRRIEADGVEYVAVDRPVVGRPAAQVIAEAVASTLRGLRTEKNMRWLDPELSYSRPIRWLLVLLGDTPVDVTVSTLTSGSTTQVLRSAQSPVVEVPSAAGFEDFLAGHQIVLDRDRRRALVVAGAQRLAASVGGEIDVEGEARLIDEITDLVEAPNPFIGSFDESYLSLPSDILTTVMRKHQRYLPVVAGGILRPAFVGVANGPCDLDLVRAGNESVLRARYEDAAFFWRADLTVPLADFRAKLATLTFEEKLGSVDDRVNRIAKIADELAATVGLDDATAATVHRAGELGKFDQASAMVTELSGLAGTMAREYATRAGETPEVAQALAEMEMPRTSVAPLPTSVAGAVASLADRFDLLTSMYAVGAIPTGTSDPYGVRRTALGILRVLRAFGQIDAVSVPDGIELAARVLREAGHEVGQDVLDAAAAFVRQRYELQLLEAGHPHNLVRAVAVRADRPAQADEVLGVLTARADDPAFAELSVALQRAQRIVAKSGSGAGEQAAALTEPAEQRLDTAITTLTESMTGHEGDLAYLIDHAGDVPGAITQFFDDVQVMSPEPAVRAARLQLLARLVAVVDGIVDWDAF